MRINKLLSNAGICSRRDANRLIEEGRIMVNGELCITGQWVEWTDEIYLDGNRVAQGEKIYILFYKPRGITTTAEPLVKDNIMSYINFPHYIFPVGRLDKESEGLMILTNDGDLADCVLGAKNAHEKVYEVTVEQTITTGFLEDLSKGVTIFGVQTRPCTVTACDENTFEIILTQGINRQIRKMCKKFGYDVIRLKRKRILNLELKGIEIGRWRHLTPKELVVLKEKLK